VDEAGFVLGLAFPNDEHPESRPLEFLCNPCIPASVRGELLEPEVAVPPWGGRTEAPAMAMPEAAVNEDGPASRAIRDVGRTRQVTIANSVAMTQASQDAAHDEFGFGACLPDLA
jgi:hypothetical protein